VLPTCPLPNLPPILVLRLRNMTAIDSTGLQALESLADQVHESGRELILCGAGEQPSRLMHQTEFQQQLGPENMCSSIAEALNRARTVYPEASKHHPVGTVWGRRSTDVLESESESAAPEPSAMYKKIT
jgi:SulP family sulfate permease